MDSNTHFVGRRGETITRHVGMTEFPGARNAHVLAAPAQNVQLRFPTVLNAPPTGVQIQKPDNMPPKPEGFLHECISPHMSISRISGAVCVPGGVALLEPDTVIDETFSAYWEKMYHHHLELIGDNTYQLKHPLIEPINLPGKYLLLDYQHIEHYGHFIMDIMTRVWAYHFCHDNLGIEDLRVIISGPLKNSYIREILHASGVKPSDIVEIDKPARCEELFVATKCAQLQEYTSPLAGATWKRVRDSLDRKSGGPSRVYLSRTRNAQRVCANEGAIERMFLVRGFHIMHPQELTEAVKIDMVANAELIAGCSGTNFYNLAFQRRLRSAMIIVSPLLIHYIDQFITQSYATDLRYFIGEIDLSLPGVDPTFVHSTWRVDLERLENEIDRWLEDVS